jgi:hypothetical protein
MSPTHLSPERRLAALEHVAKRGLTAEVKLCPYLLGISDDEAHIDEVVRRAKDAGAQFLLYGGLTLKEGPQKDRFTEVLERYYPPLVPRYEQLYPAGYFPSKEYSRRVDRMVREICRRHNMLHRMPRPIPRGEELGLNKRVAENLFLRAYEMELDGDPEYRVWAYRKAAWTVDELDESLAEIYKRKGADGFWHCPPLGVASPRSSYRYWKKKPEEPRGSRPSALGLDSLELEYHRSESVETTVYGDALLLEPGEVSAERQGPDVAVYCLPGRGAEAFRHLPIATNNKLLTILEYLACFHGLHGRYRALLENLLRTEPSQDGYLDLVSLSHLDHTDPLSVLRINKPERLGLGSSRQRLIGVSYENVERENSPLENRRLFTWKHAYE